MRKLISSVRFYSIGILGFFLFVPSFAQTDVSNLSVKLGMIRNFQPSFSNIEYKTYAVYPEVEIGGGLFVSELHWGIYFGFWDDGIHEEMPVMGYVTYSYRSVVLGCRIYLIPKFLTFGSFGTSIVGGVSYNIIKGTPLSESDVYGDTSKIIHDFLFQPSIGLREDCRISRRVGMFIEVENYFPLNGDYDFCRLFFLGGVSFSLK